MTIGKKEKWIWAAVLLFLWSAIGILLYRSSGSLTLQELLKYQPENKLLTFFVMCGLFLLKSVDFLLHFSILFAMSGILYPLPIALLINTLGIKKYFIYTRDGLRASLESSGGMRRDNNKPAGCFHSAGISFHAVYAAFRICMNSSPVMVSCSYR